MGNYNTFFGENCSVQLKIGPYLGRLYRVGDTIFNVKDGAYIGVEGVVIIQNEEVIAVADKVFSKWGDEVNPEELLRPINPFEKIIHDIKENSKKDYSLDNKILLDSI